MIGQQVLKKSDSVKVQVQISNQMSYLQKITYNKRNRSTPWETWFMVTDERGNDLSEVANKNLLSSRLYSQKELEKSGEIISIFPLETLIKTYYLKDVVMLKSKDYNTLSPGTYGLVVRYYNNSSNKVYFRIIK
nr:hypothetical protein [uncultured Mucilaginibacter sp.]